MSIVSSIIAKDQSLGAQRLITEHHTDSAGVVYVRKRFAPVGYDAAADLAAHASELANQLAEDETDKVIE